MRSSHWPITILSSIGALLNMALPMVMVRVLPPNEVGEFRIFFLYLMILPALSLSIGTVNGIYYWGSRSEKGLHFIQNAWNILLTQSCVTFIICTLFFLLARFEHWGLFQDIHTKYCLIFLIAIIPTMLSNFYDFTVIALGNIWHGALFSSGFEIIRTVLMVLSLITTKNLLFVLLAHTVVVYLRVFIGIYLASKKNIYKPFVSPNISTLKELLKYAAPVSLAAAFDVLVGSSDRLILSRFLESSEYAFYVIGCLSIPPLLIFEQSVNKVLIPQLSGALHSKDTTYAIQLYKSGVKELLSIFVPAVTGLIVFAEPILNLLFTNRYVAASQFLRVYAFSYLILSLPYDALARASGNGKWILRNCIIFGILSLFFVSLASSHWGAMGALVSSLSCQLGLRLYSLNYTRKSLHSSWSEIFPFHSALSFVFVSFILAGFSLATRNLFSTTQHWFFVTAPLFGALYLIYFYGFSLIPKCRDFLLLLQRKIKSA